MALKFGRHEHWEEMKVYRMYNTTCNDLGRLYQISPQMHTADSQGTASGHDARSSGFAVIGGHLNCNSKIDHWHVLGTTYAQQHKSFIDSLYCPCTFRGYNVVAAYLVYTNPALSLSLVDIVVYCTCRPTLPLNFEKHEVRLHIRLFAQAH